jgi:hypothetical protein
MIFMPPKMPGSRWLRKNFTLSYNKLSNMRLRLVIAFLVMVLPFASTHPEPLKTFSTEYLLRLLVRHQALKLDTTDPAKGCQIQTTVGPIETLGDYLAHLTATLEENQGQKQVTSSCKAITSGRACEVWFSTGGGTESPWRYGVGFKLNKQGELDASSVRCPGAA